MLYLKRMKLAKKLKVVCMFWFKKTNDPNAKVIVKGHAISQENWIYDNASKILPPQCIDYLDSSIPNVPPPPKDFWLLEI